MPELSWTTLWITAQIGLAVLGLRVLSKLVYPRLGRSRSTDLVTDVWAPLAAILPLLVLAGRTEWTVEGEGWLASAGPATLGVFGLGLAMLPWVDRGDHVAMPPSRGPVTWAIVALVLLLLGAAHHLTTWVGHGAMACGALLLWINTPAPPHRDEPVTPADVQLSTGMLLGLLCSIGLSAAILLGGADTEDESAMIALLFGAGCMCLCAAKAGRHATRRMAGWAGAYGVLLGIGAIALVRLAPQIADILRREQPTIRVHLAYGFGLFAFEAMLFGLIALLSLQLGRMTKAVRGVTGLVAITLALLIGVLRWLEV